MSVCVSMDAHIAWCSCGGQRPKFRSQFSVFTEGSRAWTQVIWLVEQTPLSPRHLPGSILLLTDYRIQLRGLETALGTKTQTDYQGLPTNQGFSAIWMVENCSLAVNEKHAPPPPPKKNSWGEDSAAWRPRGHCQSEVLFLSSRVGEG